jgi:uncharacterized protein (TIGR03083 family)
MASDTTSSAIGPAPMRDHAAWMRAAAEEYRRLLELLDDLTADEWAAPTDCAGWDVRAMVAHLAGAAQWPASVREMLRQQARSRRLLPGADLVDKVNMLQVQERADHTPARLVAELAEAAPRAVRARSRLPRPIRALPVPFGSPLGTKPLGYLYDRILTRDTWLHRIDICRAVGRSPRITADHDGPLVADVVAEWATLHGRPFELVLTGPAGGRWQQGTSPGEPLELDAVEFCRILSGRAPGTGLLATTVNF